MARAPLLSSSSKSQPLMPATSSFRIARPAALLLQNKTVTRAGSSIPIVLLQNLENKGKVGEVIKVKGGYARNFLIPRKIAKYASRENIKTFASMEFKEKIVSQDAKNAFLKGEIISISRAVKKNGKLFERLNVAEIGHFLRLEKGKSPNVIFISKPIQSLGRFQVLLDGVEVVIEVLPLNYANDEAIAA